VNDNYSGASSPSHAKTITKTIPTAKFVGWTSMSDDVLNQIKFFFEKIKKNNIIEELPKLYTELIQKKYAKKDSDVGGGQHGGTQTPPSPSSPSNLSAPPILSASDEEYLINLKEFYYLIHIYIYIGLFHIDIYSMDLMKIEDHDPDETFVEINAEPSYMDFSRQFSNEINNYFQLLLSSNNDRNKKIIAVISDNINRIKLYLIYISLLFNKIIYNSNNNSEETRQEGSEEDESSQQIYAQKLKNKINELANMPQNRINALKPHFIIFTIKYITSILINLDRNSFLGIMKKIDGSRSNTNTFILQGITQIMNEEQQTILNIDYLYKLFCNYLLKNTPLDVIKDEEEKRLKSLLMSNEKLSKFHREIQSCGSMAEIYQIIKEYLGDEIEIRDEGILFKMSNIPKTEEQDKKYYSKVIKKIHSDIKNLEISETETQTDTASAILKDLKVSIERLQLQIDNM